MVSRRGELTNLMRRFRQIQKLRISLGHSLNAYERTPGEKPPKSEEFNELIRTLKDIEDELIIEAELLISDELKVTSKIKGIGKKATAKIIAFADPRCFDSLSAFLAFWGCRKDRMNKCDHWLKGISADMVTRVWQQEGFLDKEDRNYLAAYYFFKEQGLSSKQARNRVRTFLLKEIYCKFNKPKGSYTLLRNGQPKWIR